MKEKTLDDVIRKELFWLEEKQVKFLIEDLKQFLAEKLAEFEKVNVILDFSKWLKFKKELLGDITPKMICKKCNKEYLKHHWHYCQELLGDEK